MMFQKPLLFLALLSVQMTSGQKEFKELKGVIRFAEPMLYMSETEVSNEEYNSYLDWLKTNADSFSWKKALPDTQAWSSLLNYSIALVTYYHSHSAYNDYPAVNISQEQARNFCAWKGARLLEYLKQEGSEIDSVIVRLPTEKEWMLAARMGLPGNAPYAWPEEGVRMKRIKKDKGMILMNFRRGDIMAEVPAGLNDKGFVTTPVKSYWPNPGGFWNMCGNVAEWIEEPGRSKGGSWHQGAYNARIDVPGVYDGNSDANPEIGFRYLIEVVSLKEKKVIPSFNMNTDYFYTGFIPLNDSVRMKDTEVSNYQYRQFLMENTNEAFKIQDSLWLRYFPYAYLTRYAHEDVYLNHPVVNISYEAAQAYCQWLTEKYQSWEKRPYKKVIYRLPTPQEWWLAAKGGRQGAMYPWGGPYTMNSRGCYLANFCPVEDQYLATDSNGKIYYQYPDSNHDVSLGVDGSIITSKIYSYFPNDWGFYNMAGNVAEMTTSKEICLGGSWRSDQIGIMISTFGMYGGPDPTQGFRVVMEIIEK